MGKKDIAKKVGEEIVKKKFDWKLFFGNTWKIVFNVSAVAGIVTIGGTAVMRVVPHEAKNDIADVVLNYENPFSKSSSSDCYEKKQRGGFGHVQYDFDNPEIQAACLTEEQYELSEKSYIDLMNLYNEWQNSCYASQGSQEDCEVDQEKLVKIENSITFNSEGYEVGSPEYYVSYQRSKDKLYTETNKLYAQFLFDKTGKEISYYDYINRKIVYGEEQ